LILFTFPHYLLQCLKRHWYWCCHSTLSQSGPP
jgi:hypothetical protein